MRIAFLSAADAEDPRALSGCSRQMARALRRAGADLVPLGPVRPTTLRAARLANGASLLLFGRRWAWRFSRLASRAYRRTLERRLRDADADVVVAPSTFPELAGVVPPVPVVYASDATFRLLEAGYGGYSRLWKWSRREATRLEGEAIRKADVVAMSSPWAARAAVEDHGADPSRVHVVPFGANLTPDAASALQRTPPRDRVRLLLVGVDWWRKGADVAVEAVQSLRRDGIDATLTVAGCQPSGDLDDPAVRLVAYAPPERAEALLRSLYRDADLFLLPARADCTPVVTAEAASMGLPVVASRVGGMPTMVRDGATGTLLEPGASGVAYAAAVRAYMEAPARYEAESRAARDHYERTLNWDAWARSILALARSARDGPAARQGGHAGPDRPPWRVRVAT